ncbi:MAG: hypothetical protein SPF30_01805 [Arcanobacterium sp.]|nr:hypothetical protein [Arcanobacterium sp.]
MSWQIPLLGGCTYDDGWNNGVSYGRDVEERVRAHGLELSRADTR